MARWTRVVGAFTAFLAIVAGLQFWAFVQSERAFLSVAGLTINGGFPQAGDPSVRVFAQIKNSGRNIAFPKHFVLAMGFGALPSKREIIDQPQLPEPPIPAGSIANPHDVIVLKKALTQGDIDSIKAGNKDVHFGIHHIFGHILAFWRQDYWILLHLHRAPHWGVAVRHMSGTRLHIRQLTRSSPELPTERC